VECADLTTCNQAAPRQHPHGCAAQAERCSVLDRTPHQPSTPLDVDRLLEGCLGMSPRSRSANPGMRSAITVSRWDARVPERGVRPARPLRTPARWGISCSIPSGVPMILPMPTSLPKVGRVADDVPPQEAACARGAAGCGRPGRNRPHEGRH
jgi:hypothetical protein